MDPPVPDTAANETAGPESLPQNFLYRCKKCSTVLCRSADIIPHETDATGRGNKSFKTKGYHEQHIRSECSSIFLDPDTSLWVAAKSREEHAEVAATGGDHKDVVEPDTIYCPKCSAKVGAQSWTGSQCSCGQWVTPAFKLHMKALDKFPCA